MSTWTEGNKGPADSRVLTQGYTSQKGVNLNPTLKLAHIWRGGKENAENLEKRPE